MALYHKRETIIKCMYERKLYIEFRQCNRNNTNNKTLKLHGQLWIAIIMVTITSLTLERSINARYQILNPNNIFA